MHGVHKCTKITIFSPTSATGRLQGCPTHVTGVSWVSDQYAPDIIIRHLTITNTSFSTSSPLTQKEDQVIPLAPIPRVLAGQDWSGKFARTSGWPDWLWDPPKAAAALETGCAGKANASRLLSSLHEFSCILYGGCSTKPKRNSKWRRHILTLSFKADVGDSQQTYNSQVITRIVVFKW